MSTFYLYEEQSGGCDYSIACGQRLRVLKGATTMQEAIIVATSEEYLGCEPGEDYGPISSDPDEDELLRASVLEVSGIIEINLANFIRIAKERKDAIEAGAAEARERAELERLKAKYGGASS